MRINCQIPFAILLWIPDSLDVVLLASAVATSFLREEEENHPALFIRSRESSERNELFLLPLE